jgi:hypothetical protein
VALSRLKAGASHRITIFHFGGIGQPMCFVETI